MGMLSIFDVSGSAVSAQSQRLNVVASNLANADTVAGPDGKAYKAREVVFQTVLMGAGGAGGDFGSADAATLGAPITADLLSGGSDGGASPALRYATPSQTNLDRNTVDMDRERAAFADNALKYESTLTFINSGVRSMLDAMKSPSQG